MEWFDDFLIRIIDPSKKLPDNTIYLYLFQTKMSVLSENFRTKRYDFSRIGIQYEHDDENASSSSSSSSSVKRKKPRCPPGSRRDKKTGRCISKTTGEAVEERTPVRKPKSRPRASAAVVEKPVFVPYPLLASTINPPRSLNYYTMEVVCQIKNSVGICT